jgi:hypothetical protein
MLDGEPEMECFMGVMVICTIWVGNIALLSLTTVFFLVERGIVFFLVKT